MTAWNFSCSGSRRAGRDRHLLERAVVVHRELLVTFSTRIEVVMSEPLRELALDTGEEPLAQPQQHQADAPA